MPRKKKKPQVIVIEGEKLQETLALSLNSIAANNQSLAKEIDATNKKLGKTRSIIRSV